MKAFLIITILVMLGNGIMAQRKTDQPDFEKSTAFALRDYKSPKSLSDYDVKFVFVNLEATNQSAYVSGSVTNNIETLTAIADSVSLEFTSSLVVDSVVIDGLSVNYTLNASGLLTMALPQPLQSNVLVSIEVFYHGISGTSSYAKGIWNDTEQVYGHQVTYTLSESFHLKDWMPCKQDLNDKIDSAWIFITVDTSLMAGSNGTLANVVPLPGGKHRFEWKTKYPMAYYLISFTVADFMEYSTYAKPAGYSDSILVQNYIYDDNQCLQDYQLAINETDTLIEFFSEKYGLYPWHDEKYGHCMAPLNGAMEHQTMTTTGYFDFGIIAHELSHQWFGDKITCASWQDIWVNEGFASYSEYISNQGLKSQTMADNWLRYAHSRAFLEPDGSCHLTAGEALNENRIFSYNLSYKKGASIIHMIRYLIDNDSIFFAGMKKIITDFADSVCSAEDVKHSFEAVSGLSLDQFFDEWYYGYGFPIYNYIYSQTAGSTSGENNIELNVYQSGSSSMTPFFHIPVEIKLNFDNLQDSLVRIYPDSSNQIFTIPIGNHSISSIVIDPNNWILDSLLSVTQSVEPIFTTNNIVVFPNPADNYLSVYTYRSADVFIYDLTGRALLKRHCEDVYTELPVNQLANGSYLLVVKSEEGNFTEKIIIRH